jgi:DNA-binding beta-propeller fold protein YncE
MILSRGGQTVVAADPDRDVVSLVGATSHTLLSTVSLHPGDEPGRIAEDGAGHFHVAMRSGGAVVTLDATGAILARQAVCSAPRGIAYDPSGDLVHVACAGGELVSFPAAGGAPTRSLQLDRDLRDIVVDGGQLLVSRFHTAQVLVVDGTGAVTQRMAPPVYSDPNTRGGSPFEPAVAWRMIPSPNGGALLLHQRGLSTAISVSGGTEEATDGGTGGSSPYGGSTSTGAQTLPSLVLPLGPLPVDAAVASGSDFIFFVSAAEGHRSPSTAVIGIPFEDATRASGCGFE